MFHGARNGRAGGPRVKNNYLPGLHQFCRRRSDAKFFFVMQPLFFVQRWIAQSRAIDWERAAVSAMQAALFVQMFQILPDGDQGSGEKPSEIGDHHAAIALDQFRYFSPTFFAQHVNLPVYSRGFDSFLLVII